MPTHITLRGRIHSIETFGTVDGPGIRFVTFLMGCPLRCLYCHNPDTWDMQGPCQYEMTPQQLLDETLRYTNYIRSGGVTVSGGEPLMQAEFVEEYFRLAHTAGLHTCLDTSGYVVGEKAQRVLQYTDHVLLDIKTMDPELYPTLTGVRQENNLRFLDMLQERHITTWVRHVVVPGLTDNDKWLNELGRYVAQYGVVEKIEVLPYHTLGVHKYKALGLNYRLDGTKGLAPQRTKEVRELLARYLPTM